MSIALLVGLILLLVLSIGASALIYSYYIYSRNRLFSKTKYSVLWLVFIGVMIIFLIIAGIFFCLDIALWNNSMEYSPAFVGLDFTILALSIAYLVCLLIIPRLTNKNKVPYYQILKVDYSQKIKAIKEKIGDLDALKTNLSTKRKRYYTDMLSYYESILNRAKNLQISKVDKLADIITFNDAFTHKWCTFTNNYQILLTFQFCEILKKIS